MIAEALDALLKKNGGARLEEAVLRSGARLVFCATEEAIKTQLPPDGSGLVVVTDKAAMLEYLRSLDSYAEERVFSVKTETMDTVDAILARTRPTLVLGFGGGRVLDVAKMVAFKANAPLVSVPTAPTHDGLLSRNCALIVNGKKVSYPTRYPTKIIIPEYLWKRSGELQKAGRLDVLSNITALQDVSLAMAEAGFIPDGTYMSLAAGAVVRVLNEINEDSLAEALFLSGLAMHESSRYCSGAEHELEKLMTPFFHDTYFHGQLVGTSTLLASLVYKRRASEMPHSLFFDPHSLYDELVDLFKKRELLGYVLQPLEENDTNAIAELLRSASAVRPERYTLWNKINAQTVDWKDVIETVISCV